MAEVSVRGGDADGLAGFKGQTRRGAAEDLTTANSTRVHLLELQEELILFWKGSSHRNYREPKYHWTYYVVNREKGK